MNKINKLYDNLLMSLGAISLLEILLLVYINRHTTLQNLETFHYMNKGFYLFYIMLIISCIGGFKKFLYTPVISSLFIFSMIIDSAQTFKNFFDPKVTVLITRKIGLVLDLMFIVVVLYSLVVLAQVKFFRKK